MTKNILPHRNIGLITQVLHRLSSTRHIEDTRNIYVLPKANYAKTSSMSCTMYLCG